MSFVFERALDTLALVGEELRDDDEEVTEAARALRGTLDRAAATGGGDLGVAAHSVVDLAVRTTRDLLQQHLPDGLSGEAATFGTTPSAEVDGLHTAADGLGGFFLDIAGAAPVNAGLRIGVGLLVDGRVSAPFAFRLRTDQPDLVPPLDVRLSEVYPRPTASFHERLSRWAERLVSRALARVDHQVQERLGRAVDDGPRDV